MLILVVNQLAAVDKWPVRAYIFRGFISCFGADTPLTPPAAGYKAFFYLGETMTIKQIAEIAQLTPETARAKGKELYPERFVNGKKTVFTQAQSIKIMEELRKKGFVQPTENLEVPTENLEVAFKMMASAFDRLAKITENQETRLAKIENRSHQ